MNAKFLILALILIGAISYFYLKPTFNDLREQVDAQAYSRTNLLEGIDTDYVAPQRK